MTPSKILKKIESLEKKYSDDLKKLANEIMDKKIIPYCQEKRVSFLMMNGIPRLVDENNEYVDLPKFILNLYEVSDSNGDRILYYCKDYKFSETVDFMKADQSHHDKKYANRELCSLIFSPAFGCLRG